MSEDEGESWNCRSDGMRAAYVPPEQAHEPNIQDPHRMVQCLGDPACYWIQHHNGIFRTTDACNNWQEIEGVEPSSFGFSVAVHPRDPDTAWFVPAVSDENRVPVDGRFLVTRTCDGGKSFQCFREGLPVDSAYDLIYRHALAVDDSGTVLAMGSTTGNLWISHNGGESWSLATGHLPPILCLQWG